MAGDLSFDVTADSDAASTFLQDAAAARELGRELDRLDGRKVRIKVELAAGSQAPIQNLNRELDKVDKRTASARVELNGAEQAEARSAAFGASLRKLPDRVSTRIEVDLDKTVGDRITALTTGITKLGTTARQVATGVTAFRTAASYLVDPGTIPIIERASAAISGKFHSAVDKARGVVDKLRSGLMALDVGFVGLAAAGQVATVVAGIGGAIAQLSQIALLAPAAIGGVGVAFATVKLATLGFTDALTGSAKKQAEAFAKMGPEAQKLVTTLKSLGPAANEFRRAVQDTAVEGLSAQVKQLAATYLPMLKTGLTGVASGLNSMAVNAVKAVQSSTAIAAVRTIVDATAKSVGDMSGSVGNAVLGFLNLAGAGSKSLTGVGSAIDAAALKFRAWTMAITQTGQFDAWVQRATTGFGQLGTILGNVGSIASTVFRTLDQNGAGLLQTLAAATTNMRNFVQSAQGASALTALAQMMSAAGNALSNVFGAALRAVAPLLVTLAPVVTALATAFGDHLVKVIELVSPALQRLATELAKHPELIADLAVKLHTAVAVFGPFVAILGVAAAVLQKMIIARVAAAAVAALGLAGTTAGAALMFLVSPLSALGQLMPALAAAVGRAGASLALLAGPIGWLIVGFAAVYASSAQFRDGMNQIAGTLGGIFMKILQDAGSTIAATVSMIGTFVSAVGSGLAGLSSAASSTMSIFGPFGQVVSDVLSTIFGWLGKLPGVAAAAFAAFVVFGKIAPIFALASTAVAAFAARMAAFSTSSAAAAIAANGLGLAAGRVATSMATFAARLPAIGVALIALGALVQATAIDFEGMSQKIAAGSMSFGQAVEQAYQQATTGLTGFMNWLEGDAVTHESIVKEMSASWDTYRASLGPMEQLSADVGRATAELNAIIASGKGGTAEAAAAAANLATAQGKLDAAHKAAADAAKTQQQREEELAASLRSQIGAMLDYEAAVRRTADAHKAAGEALAKSGAQSAEYKAAVDEIIRAVDQQAQAAKKQAEAWGGADAGIKAYNVELLRAADLSTTQGRDAFAKLAASLGETELKSLSAAAAATGLRTEIMKLPDGRTVTVVVAADQGKLPEVRKQVADFAAQKYVGTVELRATTENARGDIQQAVTFANGQTGTIRIAADGSPAIVTVGATKYQVDATTGTMKILGDPAPGEANLSGLKLKVDGTTGAITIEGNTGPVDSKTAAAKGAIDSSIGTITIDGNATNANGKTTAAVTFADGSKGTITIDGNQTPANGKVDATVTYGNGKTSIIKVDANAAAANAAIDNAARPRYATINVNTVYTSADVRAAHGGAIGGIVTPMARGGVLDATGYATGGIRMRPMRGGIAQRVPAGDLRVIGDRIRGAEYYLPDDDAPRTMKIGAEWARRRGLSLVDMANGSTPVGQVDPRAAAVATVASRVANAGGPRGRGHTTVVQPPNLGPLLARIGSLEKTIAAAVAAARPITVQAQPGSEVEAGRAVRLSLR